LLLFFLVLFLLLFSGKLSCLFLLALFLFALLTVFNQLDGSLG
jgi:hypothetical protein